jgi:hypothetical protein
MKLYSVECKYGNEPTDRYFSLIQTLDDDKMLALNTGISIVINFFLMLIPNLCFTLDHLMNGVLNLIKQ